MATVLLATLGQRPEAITIALDALQQQRSTPYAELCVIHTHRTLSGIAEAREQLLHVLRTDYPDLPVCLEEIKLRDGSALIDIHNHPSAMDYYHGMLRVIHAYQHNGDDVHLLVSGGRKSMSAFATLAATLLFGKQDRLYTVISPPSLITMHGAFHAPPMLARQVIIVEMPLIPVRMTDGARAAMPDDIVAYAQRRANPREDFLRRLTPQERVLVDELTHTPYAQNNELAAALHKSPKTIERQFSSIYKKMIGYLDTGEVMGATKRRQALIDILLDRF